MTEFGEALRDALVAWGGCGERIWSDWAPEAETLPYVTFTTVAASSVLISGDGQTSWRRQLTQVDLWQARGDASDGLAQSLVTALDGLALDSTPQALPLSVEGVQRLYEPATEIVHHALTLGFAVRAG